MPLTCPAWRGATQLVSYFSLLFVETLLTLAIKIAFDTLPSRALPIYTRYKTSSGAIRSKLGSLVGFSPVQAGTLSLSGTTYTVDLRKGFGSSARLRSSTKTVVSSTPNRNARAWERFQPSTNSFGDTVFLSFAAGGAPPAKCKKGKTTTLPYAAQICVFTVDGFDR
jgi:hypothetical protein